jgi:hypothetical protein
VVTASHACHGRSDVASMMSTVMHTSPIYPWKSYPGTFESEQICTAYVRAAVEIDERVTGVSTLSTTLEKEEKKWCTAGTSINLARAKNRKVS